MVNGNSKEASNYFKKERFHIIVGDLPYGIFHGNTAEKKGASKSRNPITLLSESLPEWYGTLKTNGCIVLAWNTFLISREKMIALFKAAGFEVFTQPPYDTFEHRVDQSIKRDILVAKKV